jgi:hypothetical protein
VGGTDTRFGSFVCDTASALYQLSAGVALALSAGTYTVKLQFSASAGTASFARRYFEIKRTA